MVTHTRNSCSAFTHPNCTHTRSSGQPFMLRRPGSSWGFGVWLKGNSVVVLKVERAVGVRCLAQGHLSRGIEGGESSWGFGVLLKGTSVVVLKVEGAVGGSVSCSRAPQSWYWRWREQLGVRCLAQGHLSRGIEGGGSSWGFGVLLKDTSVVVLKVERAVGGSVSCSRAPQSWYWRWREQLGVRCLAQGHLSRGIEGGGSSWGFGALLKGTSVVVLKVEGAVGGSVPCSRAPQSWYWRWREQLGVRCLAQGHLSRGIEGGGSSWGFGALLKGTSVVVLKVERAVGGSVPCSRAPQSWYWRWREQLGVRCLAQGHLSRGIEGGESSWGFGALLKGTSVVVLKVERAVGGSVPCSRAPQSWYWRWREQLGVRCLAQGHLSRGIEGGESSWGFGALLKGTSVVVLKVKRAVGGSVPCSRTPQSWYWRWREQLGVRCLAQGHLSRGIEGGESAVHSLPPPPQFPPAWDSNPQPFDYKSNSLPLNHDFHEPQTVPLSGNIVNKTNLFSFKFAWMHLKRFLNWVTDIRVGPEIVTDPAFLVTRLVMETLSTFFLMPAEEKKHKFLYNELHKILGQLKCKVSVQYSYRSMEDFVTWVDSSKIKQHVMNYNEEVCRSIFFHSLKPAFLWFFDLK